MTQLYDQAFYPKEGEVIDGKYRIERRIGEGGMGAVLEATHLLRKARVALKFMSPGAMAAPSAVERFMNEAVAASRIKSEHVVSVLDVARTQEGVPYLVMEHLQGEDLAQVLDREGRDAGLPVPRATHFVVQVLRALQAAHAVGIVHRDLKPANCFVISHEGDQDFVKVLDFGISKVQEPGGAQITRTNAALGTPLYMSPEQGRNPKDVDFRSDLYSVGVVLYELLSGRTPYHAESGEFTEVLFKLFTTEPSPLAEHRKDLPPGLAAAVHKALARERDQRYASARDMADALAPFCDARSDVELARLRAFRAPDVEPALVVPADADNPPPSNSALGDAFASTQYSPDAPATSAKAASHSPPTDLSATSEGPLPAEKVEAPRGRALVVAAAILGVAVVGAAALVVSRGAAPASGPAVISATPPPPASAAEPPPVPAPTPAPTPCAAPSVKAPAPSAAPSVKAAPGTSSHATPPRGGLDNLKLVH